jgi:enterochelin esterase family protein
MRFWFLAPLFFLICSSAVLATADQCADQWVLMVESQPLAKRQDIADQYLSALPSNPVCSSNGQAQFLFYQGDGRNVQLAGDWTSWDIGPSFEHIPGTNVWYLVTTFPVGARLDYKLIIDGQWRLDNRNPHTMMGGFGPNSELRFEYQESWWLQSSADIIPCRLDTLIVQTPNLGGERTVVVVIPPRAQKQRRPFMLVHDGLEYLTIAGLDVFLAQADQLIDDVSVPICVCVPPVQRTEEYAGSQQAEFTRWIVEDLIPMIEQRYSEEGLSRRAWGSMGASYGGRITLDLARRYPLHFDRLAPMSPSVAPAQHEGIAALDPASVRIHLTWGTYDIPSIIPECKDLATLLNKRDVHHEQGEFPQGHSWGLWRDMLDPAFRFLYEIRSD